MTLDPLHIDMIQHDAHMTAKRKGWWDEPSEPGTKLMLIVSELAEALEELRDGHRLQEIRFGPDGKPEGFTVELADAIIRIGDMCGGHNLPLARAITLKLAYNETRPYKHGKAL